MRGLSNKCALIAAHVGVEGDSSTAKARVALMHAYIVSCSVLYIDISACLSERSLCSGTR